MQKEIWKDIKDFEGIYQISNLSNVRSLDREETYYRSDFNSIVKKYRKGIILKQKLTDKGYYSVHLRNSSNNLEQWPSVHRLVAEAFILNPENKPTVNHIDGNKLNNSVSNLEWATHQEQTKHAFDNNLMFVRGNTLYNEEFKLEVIEYYKKTGLSYNKIALHFGFSSGTASRIIKGKWGDSRKIPKHDASKAMWLRDQGFTLKKISEILECGISSVHRLVKTREVSL